MIIFSSSLLFSLFTINTLNTFFRKPLYLGSFLILIKDPIDSQNRGGSFDESLALNNTVSHLGVYVLRRKRLDSF